MENVRNFFNEVVEFEIEEVKKGNLHINHGFPQIGNFDFQRLCAHIDKIANKLLSMQKEEREVYAKWLVETIIDRYKVVALYDVENVKVKSSGVIKYRDEKEPINEALEYIITPIPFRKIEIIGRCDNVECDIELIQSDIDMFVKSVFSILADFNLGLNVSNMINEAECEQLTNIYNMSCKDKNSLPQENTRKSKRGGATAKNKYGILCAFIKASGYTVPDGSKFASFISWLCGGSAESIRQNVCCKYDCGDEETLKEKFASIGITYEDGKIKPA